MENRIIYTTRPFLPPIAEFTGMLEAIWENRILTNNGPYHKEFESKLSDYLGVKYVSLFTNGTLALVAALKALSIEGEVITTPYSFVGIANAITFCNLKPVFVDIEPDHFNLNPDKIELAITPKTTAILPVHVYGYPAQVMRIREVAERNGLKVIYDACHTFGVKLKDIPIVSFGDLSVMSFHATKVFNTLEGGAVISNSEEMKIKIDLLKNFGFTDEVSVVEQGFNAKMNEVQAALGILQLKYIDQNIEARKRIVFQYRKLLHNIEGLRILDDMKDVEHCYSYFPILIDSERFGLSRDDLYDQLKSNGFYGRRYFYPIIPRFEAFKNIGESSETNWRVAESISHQVICLPLFPEITESDVNSICNVISNSKNPTR